MFSGYYIIIRLLVKQVLSEYLGAYCATNYYYIQLTPLVGSDFFNSSPDFHQDSRMSSIMGETVVVRPAASQPCELRGYLWRLDDHCTHIEDKNSKYPAFLFLPNAKEIYFLV
jgi:hypothetical protein